MKILHQEKFFIIFFLNVKAVLDVRFMSVFMKIQGSPFNVRRLKTSSQYFIKKIRNFSIQKIKYDIQNILDCLYNHKFRLFQYFTKKNLLLTSIYFTNNCMTSHNLTYKNI